MMFVPPHLQLQSHLPVRTLPPICCFSPSFFACPKLPYFLKYMPDCFPLWICHCLLVIPPHQHLVPCLSTVPIIIPNDCYIPVGNPTSDLLAFRPLPTPIRNLLPWSTLNLPSASNCSTYKLFRKMDHYHLLI